MAGENTAGERYDDFLEVCECVVDHSSLFEEREVDFARSMADRLVSYGKCTYIFVAQINWINRLEQKLKDEGLL